MATPTENSRLVGILEKVAVGALMLIVGWHQTSIAKLEDRIFDMQGEMFTEAKARVLEERITKNIDAIRSDVRNDTRAIREDINQLIRLQRVEKN